MRPQRIAAGLLLVAMLLLIAGPVAADKGGEPASFRAIAVDCAVVDPGTVTLGEDGILRIRGLKSTGFIESDNRLVAGRNDVELDADLNTKTDTRKYWVKVTIYPTDYPGSSWVAPGESGWGHFAPVIHRGYGTGLLEGLRIKFSALRLPDGYPGPGDPPCPDPALVLDNQGVIVGTGDLR